MSEPELDGAYIEEKRKSDMAPAEPATSHLSAAQITEAIRGLATAELLRLKAIGRYLARSFPADADDLVQEACCRAMDGSRLCPRDVGVVVFLAGVMRSIASGNSKARRRHPQLQLVVTDNDGVSRPRDFADETMTAEEKIIAEADEEALIERASATKRQILELFEDDAVAQTLVEGIMVEMEGEELRSLTELDKTAFASKRRLIRRRIAKAIPESKQS